MPSIHEVRLYLTGLWLLIRGDAQGFRLLDISDRGMARSFWAFVWCLPAAIISWLWLRKLMLAGLPEGSRLGALFFARVGMLEVLNWLIPVILAGLVCLFFGIHRKFPAIVVAINWLSVPFTCVNGLLCLGLLVMPRLMNIAGLFQLGLMLALVIAFARIMRMICGQEPLMITAFVLILIIPNMLLTDMLQRFLNIYPF